VPEWQHHVAAFETRVQHSFFLFAWGQKRARRRQGSDYNLLSLDRNVNIRDHTHKVTHLIKNRITNSKSCEQSNIDKTSRFCVGEGKKPNLNNFSINADDMTRGGIGIELEGLGKGQ